jgi:hypothetical protein
VKIGLGGLRTIVVVIMELSSWLHDCARQWWESGDL